MGHRIVIGITLAALLAACEEATAPEAAFDGLAFVWDGGSEHRSRGTPSFQSEGVLSGQFAVAFPDTVGGLVLASFHPREGRRGDLFILQVTERGVGVTWPCAPSSQCHGRFLEDVDPEDLSVVPQAWEITDGRVSIEVDGPDRVRGRLTDLVLSVPGDEPGREIEEGTFDVPLLSGEDGADIMRCFLRRLTGGSCS